MLPVVHRGRHSGRFDASRLDFAIRKIAVHSGDCGWVFSENVSEQTSVISTGEFSIAFESFGTALYLLRVSDIGCVLPQGHHLQRTYRAFL